MIMMTNLKKTNTKSSLQCSYIVRQLVKGGGHVRRKVKSRLYYLFQSRTWVSSHRFLRNQGLQHLQKGVLYHCDCTKLHNQYHHDYHDHHENHDHHGNHNHHDNHHYHDDHDHHDGARQEGKLRVLVAGGWAGGDLASAEV